MESKNEKDTFDAITGTKLMVRRERYEQQAWVISDILQNLKNLPKESDKREKALRIIESSQERLNSLHRQKKDCDLTEIVNAVTETRRGNKFFCGQILDTIQKAEINVNDLDFDSFTCEAIVLSERENEIIKLVAEGNTNNKIAELLFLSSHTVNTHRKNIMAKLGVKNTAGIVMYAVKMNIVSPNRFLFTPNTES